MAAKKEYARVTLPPLLHGLTRAAIISYLRMPLKTVFVNNNQAVERQVALMSTCGKKVVGEDRKSGQQIAVAEHRQETKKQKN